ncbi:uncharacterized protein LOC130052135 [Ostrea edulis]|uniref:uncharacterized protein LOC130052135 n=1 Tax=Ostrea edulis TaxID=37623 RepID=UPI0024AEF6FF|nr:uncharacterized protein LOC130052135 [Ostrea edulis]
MHQPISPGVSFGDSGQDDLLQDQNSSSQRTMWAPLKENVPRRENSDELLSTSSSSTDYYSCFDSDSDSESEKKKRLHRESNSWVTKAFEGGAVVYDTTVSSSPLHLCVSDDEFIDFSAMQSMKSKRNTKIVMRYRHIPEIEYTLDGEISKSKIVGAMPSWCQVFKPLNEVTEDAVVKHDVKSLVHSFENLSNAEEKECKTSCLSKGKIDHVDLVI